MVLYVQGHTVESSVPGMTSAGNLTVTVPIVQVTLMMGAQTYAHKTNAHKTNAHKTYAHNTNAKRDICSQFFL